MIAASFSVAINTDIPSLIGGDAEIVSLARKSSNTLRVLCDTPAAVEAAKSVFDFDTPIDPKSMYMLLSEKGEGVLGDKARRLLGDGETKKIERAAKRRDFMGVGLFPKAIDPYYFLNDFVLELKAYKPELPEGAELLYGLCRGEGSSVKIKNLLSLAKERKDIHLSGSPFHTLIATERTKREVNFLGVISIAAVFVLGFLLARTWRIFPLLFLALTLGFAAAILVVILVFKSIHVVTILFGTSLIGLGVDYCYHGFLEPEKKKELTSALITTSLAFVPLFFSGVAALSQMALFTIVGIVVIYLVVIFTAVAFGKRRNPNDLSCLRPANTRTTEQIVRGLSKNYTQHLRTLLEVSAVAIIAYFGINKLSFDNSPDAFYKPDSFLAENEEAVKKVSNPDSLGFSLVDLEDWQRENLELKMKLIPSLNTQTSYIITSEDLPPQMTVEIGGRAKLILPGKRHLKEELNWLLEKFAFKAVYGIIFALVTIYLVAVFVYRSKHALVVGPVLFSLFMTLFTLPIFGEKINFFHILSLFIVMGLGIDYSIFHFDKEGVGCRCRSTKVVFFSFLTSLLGFGLLGLTSFPVTRSMGLTIALGLVYSYILSLPSKKSPSSINTPAGAWHSQSEQSAGKLRIMLIFWIYKYLGKSAAKLLFFPAFLFIYPFCRPAKAALEDFYRVTGLKGSVFKQLLSFAWSMIDKTDACSLNKNPPKIKLKGDLDWMKGGCFLLSTHLGCIEVLPALRSEYPGASKVNAFQQLGHDAVFTEIFLKYMDKDQLTLHAVEDIGVETAANMKEAIERGEIVLMAGDRPSAGSKAVLKHKFFGHVCEWPKGVFRFARLMESPVYAITMVKTGWSSYEVHAKKLDVSELLPQYVEFLESEVSAYPEQWYNFYQYFR